jgi:hypothetical protein
MATTVSPGMLVWMLLVWVCRMGNFVYRDLLLIAPRLHREIDTRGLANRNRHLGEAQFLKAGSGDIQTILARVQGFKGIIAGVGGGG